MQTAEEQGKEAIIAPKQKCTILNKELLSFGHTVGRPLRITHQTETKKNYP